MHMYMHVHLHAWAECQVLVPLGTNNYQRSRLHIRTHIRPLVAWISSTRLNYVYLILKWYKLCFHGNCVGKIRLIGGS